MAIEKKVETLEGEVKLMKGELKETLTSVRDFLVNLKLPTPQIEGLEGGDSRLTVDGGLAMQSAGAVLQQALPAMAQAVQGAAIAQVAQPAQPVMAAAPSAPAAPQVLKVEMVAPSGNQQAVTAEPMEAAAPGFLEAAPMSPLETSWYPKPQEQPEQPNQPEATKAPRIPEKEEERNELVAEPAIGSSSQVNLLANLLRWVSVATMEIGSEQLPTFLDIYGTTGNLSPETREVILRFANVVAQQPAFASADGIMGHIMTEQLATFLEVHSANGKLSPDVKEGILRFASTMVTHPLERSMADVWSRLLLELHGILSGGGRLTQASGMVQAMGELAAEADEAEVEADGAEESPDLEKDEEAARVEEKTV
ncbi:MAG: hypothetical protein KKF26_07420, partial [Chloroflexi bacterium]|nr:hypothetical protein [Chloroflexota bacterium]